MQRYDLVLRGSRVLDPANSFDSVSDIGIRAGLVEAISDRMPESETDRSIDLSGLWAIPGQIDTHAHVAGMSRTVDPAIGYRMLARAGTTTVLDMGGTGDNLINGLNRKGAGLNVAGLLALVPGLTIPSDSPSKGEIATTVSGALRQGCIGVKILGGYHPFSSETTADIVSECNQQNAYVAFHIGTKDSGSHLGGLREIPDIVGDGRLHVCHVNSYCRGVIERPEEECIEAISIMKDMRGQLNTEVYHAIPNGTNGSCDREGNVIANVPRNCLQAKNYSPTFDGMKAAILDGYASVIQQKGDDISYVKGPEALKLYESSKTRIGMSFPVNLPASAFSLTTAKNSDGEFIVDAVSTDGGSHPRNIAIQSTMSLVKFGAISPLEMSKKLSLTPSRMLGLKNKGHFTEGADADITVIDPVSGEPVMSFVAGNAIMANGKILGTGGTLLVTSAAERKAEKSGIPFQVIDLGQSKLYKGF